MKSNQMGYKFLILLFFHGSSLLGSQLPCVSLDIWKTITALQCYKHERYRLYSSRDVLHVNRIQNPLEKSLIIELRPEDKKSQSFYCTRLDSDTLLLLSAQTKQGGKVVFASCCAKGNSDEQLVNLKNFFNSRRDVIKNVKMLALCCQKDAGLILTDEMYVAKHKKELQEVIGVQPEVVGYTMIGGNDFRDKEHFECQIDLESTLWRSAIDKFQEHRL